MWLPRGLGADPQVDTTVAIAIGAPVHARAAASTESLSATFSLSCIEVS
jgi:hypothetical protein